MDADSNNWAAKQTFDSREKSGARHVRSLDGRSKGGLGFRV